MKSSGPKLLLHLEGLMVLLAAVMLYRSSGGGWGKFFILFLVPDFSLLGYVLGIKVGALAYNAIHTYMAPLLLWLIAVLAHQPALVPLCLIWLAHIGFDRLLGYGLKYPTTFKDTHLARV